MDASDNNSMNSVGRGEFSRQDSCPAKTIRLGSHFLAGILQGPVQLFL